MKWALSHRADNAALGLADRHYNRQKIGSSQFVPPGRSMVLLHVLGTALWVTRWPQFTMHRWPGAWECTLFRNESHDIASELITDAVAVTRWRYGEPPEFGMLTFVNPSKIRRTRRPGYTFMRAGFIPDGTTKGGLLAFLLPPDLMPPPQPPFERQGKLL